MQFCGEQNAKSESMNARVSWSALHHLTVHSFYLSLDFFLPPLSSFFVIMMKLVTAVQLLLVLLAVSRVSVAAPAQVQSSSSSRLGGDVGFRRLHDKIDGNHGPRGETGCAE